MHGFSAAPIYSGYLAANKIAGLHIVQASVYEARDYIRTLAKSQRCVTKTARKSEMNALAAAANAAPQWLLLVLIDFCPV